ncbi:MAG: 30S ribosomal protein S20 [Candidatus Margulisiibacteriota bacterium]
MANIKSAVKRIKTSSRNEQRNKALKARVKKAVKEAKTAISVKSEQAGQALKDALKRIDKSVTKGLLHKRTAARKKSRLMKLFNRTK